MDERTMNESSPGSESRATRAVRRSAVRAGAGLAGVAALTIVLVHLDFRSALLYLIVVVFVSLTGDFVASALASVVAFLCLAYFFTPSATLLGLNDPLNLIALLAFLTTAFVVTRLVSRRRAAFQEVQTLRDQLALVIDTIPALTGVSLPSGAVEVVNRRWLEYTGLRLADAQGEGWRRVLHPDDRAVFSRDGARGPGGPRSVRSSRCACGVRTASIGGS